LRCQLGREVGDREAMSWAAIFREKWGAFNGGVFLYSCSCS
jgi:hypothetical protein